VVWLERAKIGEETLSVFKIFTASATFNKCKQKRSSSEEINGNCYVFANSRWAILPALLLANSRYLGISQRLSNTFYELPRGFPIAFGHFPAAFLYPNSSTQRLSNSL
jgi:hypothetical protein